MRFKFLLIGFILINSSFILAEDVSKNINPTKNSSNSQIKNISGSTTTVKNISGNASTIKSIPLSTSTAKGISISTTTKKIVSEMVSQMMNKSTSTKYDAISSTKTILEVDDKEVIANLEFLGNEEAGCSATYFKGKVTVKTRNDFDWRDIVAGERFIMGDNIKTKNNSEVEVICDNGSLVLFQPNTDIMLRELYNNPAFDENKMVFDLGGGRVFADISGMRGDSSFEIKTKNSIIIVNKNAKIMVEINPNDNSTMLVVFDGKAEFWNMNKEELKENKTFVYGKQESMVLGLNKPSPPSKMRAKLIIYKEVFKKMSGREKINKFRKAVKDLNKSRKEMFKDKNKKEPVTTNKSSKNRRNVYRSDYSTW